MVERQRMSDTHLKTTTPSSTMALFHQKKCKKLENITWTWFNWNLWQPSWASLWEFAWPFSWPRFQAGCWAASRPDPVAARALSRPHIISSVQEPNRFYDLTICVAIWWYRYPWKPGRCCKAFGTCRHCQPPISRKKKEVIEKETHQYLSTCPKISVTTSTSDPTHARPWQL